MMSNQIPQPRYYQLVSGAWTWHVRAANGEPFVAPHEPDGFSSRESAERNFALCARYFEALYLKRLSDEAAKQLADLGPVERIQKGDYAINPDELESPRGLA